MTAIYITSFDFHVLSNSSLGERLKFFRQHLMQYEKDMDMYTIKAIAERLNLTPQAISAVERGLSKNPSFGLILKLTKEYNVSMDTLTDEYYEGNEKLFSIGKSDVQKNVFEVDLDALDIEDEDITEFEAVNKPSPKVNTGYWDEEKNDYALPETEVGILLYKHEDDSDEFNILYKNSIKSGSTEKELQKLLVRLDLDIRLLNNVDVAFENISSILKKHGANDYMISSKELLKLLKENN